MFRWNRGDMASSTTCSWLNVSPDDNLLDAQFATYSDILCPGRDILDIQLDTDVKIDIEEFCKWSRNLDIDCEQARSEFSRLNKESTRLKKEYEEALEKTESKKSVLETMQTTRARLSIFMRERFGEKSGEESPESHRECPILESHRPESHRECLESHREFPILESHRECLESHRECPICYDSRINACMCPCGHTMCLQCWEKSNKNKCPICRSNVEGVLPIAL